jgi:hypothetical protein
VSDLVQFILNEVKGPSVVTSGGSRSLRSSASRTRSDLFIADFDAKTKKERVCPYGLAQGGNNWLESHKISQPIKYGAIDRKNILNDFKKMLVRVDGSRSPLLINEAGELKTFPTKSRWNSEYNYSWIVGQRALDEVKGLKKVTHLILTFDPDIVKQIIPDWWFLGSDAYLAVVGGFFVSDFLRKLRMHKRKLGEPNNFITWVMEFTERGMVHFHLLFYGSWVAKIEDLSKFWPYSQPNGIRFGKRIKHHDNGAVLASYLTRYITKSLSPMGDVDKKIKDKMELIRALLWLFKKRLYNMRHKIRNSDGEYTLGIGREQYINPVKWQKYVPPFEILSDDFEKMYAEFKNSHEYS